MKKIFLSHAANEKALATQVRRMIAAAIGIQPSEIFYSSGKGTGIPAGQNFVSYIRDEMEDSTYVVALIGPGYLASEFCLAELGAVWYASDKRFHPLCTPSVDRGKLRASLTGIQVDKVEDEADLQQLLQEVARHFDREHNVATCTSEVGVFLEQLDEILEGLPKPSTVSREKLDEVEAVKDKLAKDLADERTRYEELERRFDELKAAKTVSDAEAISVSSTVEHQIDEAISKARQAVRELDHIVRKALPYQLKSEGMPWPDQFSYDHEKVQSAIDAGYLRDSEDGEVYLNLEWPQVEEAAQRIQELQDLLDNLDPGQADWFKDQYGVPPDLAQRAAFEELF